jgi:dTDP-4-amino-4,6-dideoxygalactose transaminase
MEVAYAKALSGVKGRSHPFANIVPPNRLETSIWDLLAALGATQKQATLGRLRERISQLTGRKHIYFAPSCRSAIAQILRLLPNQEVVMPAYTCPVVKTAVQLAGKRIIYVDVERNGVNSGSAEYNAQAKPGRVLLPTHLFGIPTDIEAICELARDRKCVTIEDAAAAAFARRNGRILGTFGDFGIISFERSKRFPAFRGAAIIVNNESLVDLQELTKPRLPKTRFLNLVRDPVFALIYNLATIPWVYGRFTLHTLLQRYKNAATESEESSEELVHSPFYTQEFISYQAALVLRMLDRIDRIQKQVAALVETYMELFRQSEIRTFVSPGHDKAALLRFPIALPGRDRTQVLRSALKRGLFLETNYEVPLPSRSVQHQFPNALWMAENLVLLPLYRLLTVRRARQISTEILRIAGETLTR